MAIITKRDKQNFRCIIFGVPGCGKTELALKAEGYLLLDVERGSRLLGQVRRIDEESNPLKTSEQIIEALREGFSDKETKTIVLDSITALNQIFESEVLKEMNIPSLLHNFGSGYAPMQKKWNDLLEITAMITEKGNKNVILIGHNETKNEHDALLGTEVKKETIHLDKKSFKNIVAAMDGVFFYGYEKILDEKKKTARGTGRRVLTTNGCDDMYVAKSRFKDLPRQVYFGDNEFDKMREFWKGLGNV